MKYSQRTLMVLALVVLWQPANAEGPFAGAADLGDGNHYSTWFDYFNDQFYPWVYHYDHGWLYCNAVSESNIWLWNPGLGWIWTSSNSYPNLYEENRGWIFYARGSTDPRWFFDRAPEEWVSDAAVSQETTYFPVPGPDEAFFWHYEVNGGNPVSGQFDGIILAFDFTRYEVTFSGASLRQTTLMDAGLAGTVFVDGQFHEITGFMSVSEISQYKRDAIGVYLDSTQAGMVLGFDAAGDELLVTASATSSSFGELLVNLPWREDLYQFPVGTVYDQWIPYGWVEGSFELKVNEVVQQKEDFSTAFTPAIRYELTEKLPIYFLGGRSYSNVVVIVASVLTPDPFGGPASYLDNRMWLAPGIGLIRSLIEDPMLDDPIEVVLVETNLWQAAQ
jgi:hypothetical protein